VKVLGKTATYSENILRKIFKGFKKFFQQLSKMRVMVSIWYHGI